ncbi:hypothetical protein E4634_17070 [Mangrovimicrobium sediminis]|uniref:Cytochrome c domain-containing protein n=1 Tax=Mangrovimicrobium sediminis TaxID=2562682 RepID=A0A4Z0LXZ6_9GAMM|nr:hypothetical protein E4634_17070 [Haliea sp. SAOS-164]
MYTAQGDAWNNNLRQQFYSQDQGSRMLPLSWMQALRQANGTPFLAGSLSRYGYLPNELEPGTGLPIGFSVASMNGEDYLGMTCSACHTRQITYQGTSYRLDGGPGIVDFQQMLADMDAAFGLLLANPATFDQFAKDVLGQQAGATARAELKLAVETWYLPFHTITVGSLPAQPWGLSRLDAVGMIFNRLTGLDIGPPPNHIIAENIHVADAPVRYPFLWNAARQDKTQWPGFADNGNALFGLARNVGEVIGVFGQFQPEKRQLVGIDYMNNNSINFGGLKALEEWLWLIGPPAWPWELDPTLAAQGKAIFDRDTEAGGCVECHGISKGAFRSLDHDTWKTPVVDVGTDTRECELLTRTAKTGVLEGARIPVVKPDPLKETDAAVNILGLAVIGSILQYELGLGSSDKMKMGAAPGEPLTLEQVLSERSVSDNLKTLESAFPTVVLPNQSADGPPRMMGAAPGCAYEARVLQGIWGAAPYLHNGSVPTLADLLEPAALRPASFRVGAEYDPVKVGLSGQQPGLADTLHTTDCAALDSGNSRCGHEFGTELPPQEKLALLEYLKSI